MARGVANALPWIVRNDFSLLVLVGDGGKSLHAFSELACVVATQQGVTELSLTDHDVSPAVEARDVCECC